MVGVCGGGGIGYKSGCGITLCGSLVWGMYVRAGSIKPQWMRGIRSENRSVEGLRDETGDSATTYTHIWWAKWTPQLADPVGW